MSRLLIVLNFGDHSNLLRLHGSPAKKTYKGEGDITPKVINVEKKHGNSQNNSCEHRP